MIAWVVSELITGTGQCQTVVSVTWSDYLANVSQCSNVTCHGQLLSVMVSCTVQQPGLVR